MMEIAQCLVTEEFRVGRFAGTKADAAFRVCDKLRQPLVTLVGIVGFRTLLTRALMLAKEEAPQLAKVRVDRDGTLAIPSGVEVEFEGMAGADGGAALVAQLLGLLVTFIGEALTLRLVDEVWPKAVRKSSEQEGKKS
jgi:hypothetical protein